MSDPLLHFPALRPLSRIPRTVAELTGALALAVLTVGLLFLVFGGLA